MVVYLSVPSSKGAQSRGIVEKNSFLGHGSMPGISSHLPASSQPEDP